MIKTYSSHKKIWLYLKKRKEKEKREEKKKLNWMCKDTKCVTWCNAVTTLGILSVPGDERTA